MYPPKYWWRSCRVQWWPPQMSRKDANSSNNNNNKAYNISILLSLNSNIYFQPHHFGHANKPCVTTVFASRMTVHFNPKKRWTKFQPDAFLRVTLNWAAGLLISAASKVTRARRNCIFGSLRGCKDADKPVASESRCNSIQLSCRSRPITCTCWCAGIYRPLKVNSRRPSTRRQNRMRGTASYQVMLPLTCSLVAQE